MCVVTMSANPSRLALVLALLGTTAICGAATTLINSALPINLDAQSSDFDYRNNLLLFRHVKISQGDTSVEADEATATGLKFDDSRWDFHGNVRITLPDGNLLSDAATIQFAKNALSSALITGSPATFEQKHEKCLARGRAGKIEYDFASETVRMSEQAWISYGDGEISGRTLVYSIHEQRVMANPQDQGDQRVHITINPHTPANPQAPAGTAKCGK